MIENNMPHLPLLPLTMPPLNTPPLSDPNAQLGVPVPALPPWNLPVPQEPSATMDDMMQFQAQYPFPQPIASDNPPSNYYESLTLPNVPEARVLGLVGEIIDPNGDPNQKVILTIPQFVLYNANGRYWLEIIREENALAYNIEVVPRELEVEDDEDGLEPLGDEEDEGVPVPDQADQNLHLKAELYQQDSSVLRDRAIDAQVAGDTDIACIMLLHALFVQSEEHENQRIFERNQQ